MPTPNYNSTFYNVINRHTHSLYVWYTSKLSGKVINPPTGALTALKNFVGTNHGMRLRYAEKASNFNMTNSYMTAHDTTLLFTDDTSHPIAKPTGWFSTYFHGALRSLALPYGYMRPTSWASNELSPLAQARADSFLSGAFNRSLAERFSAEKYNVYSCVAGEVAYGPVRTIVDPSLPRSTNTFVTLFGIAGTPLASLAITPNIVRTKIKL